MTDKNNKSTIEKIVMGAIIGTAIGSAIGITLAPKKGVETRKIIKDNLSGNTSEAKEVVKLSKETMNGIWTIAKRIFLGKKQAYKEIPDESSVEIIENESKKTKS